MVAPPERSDLVVGHPEREHTAGVDPGVGGAAVEHRRPLVAVAGRVDVEQRLLELGVLGGEDVDGLGLAVDGDGEVLAGEVGGTDRRALTAGRSRMWRNRTDSGDDPKWKRPR
jgi:hypothetical protein